MKMNIHVVLCRIFRPLFLWFVVSTAGMATIGFAPGAQAAVMTFDACATSGPYTEAGLTVESLIDHLHCGDNDGDGSPDLNNHDGGCCTSPYLFTPATPGETITFVRMDVRSGVDYATGGDLCTTFTALPSGASVCVPSAGAPYTYVFPPGFSGTSIRWNTGPTPPGTNPFDGEMTIDNLVFNEAAADPGPEANLIVNGIVRSDEVSVSNPVTLEFFLRECGAGRELFLVLKAPAIGVPVFSYRTMAGAWVPVPADLSQILPFMLSPGDGRFPLFTGTVPRGVYDIYFGCDFVMNGHLDYLLGAINGVFDHVVVTVQ